MLYLSIFGSILAFGFYLKLVGNIGPHRAVYAVVMFPVVAVVLSVIFEDMLANLELIGGVVLVLAGNLLILGERKARPDGKVSARRQTRRRKPRSAAPPLFAGIFPVLRHLARTPEPQAGEPPILCCDGGPYQRQL